MAISRAERTRLRNARTTARRNLIARTARIWTRSYRDLTASLKETAQNWLNKLQQQARKEIASGYIETSPEIPEKFTQTLQRKLRESMAQGYWLNHLYVQELKSAYQGRKYSGKVTLSDLPDDEEIKELLRAFIELDASNEWYEIIPIEAVNWLNDYVPKLAGILNTAVLERTREVIQKSMLEGSTLQERMKALRESSEELARMTAQRIEAIARTEITRADSMGRLIQMKANEDVIGVEFSAVMDDRTTEMCIERNGLMMRLDDPRLPENTPPIHINCRSLLLSLTVYDFPDGVLTSHEFDEVPTGIQRTEDIEEVRMLLSSFDDIDKGQPEIPAVIIPEAKTIAEANTIAVQYGLAQNADFGKLDVSVANEMIKELQSRHDMFPDLPELDFVGSMQCQEEWKIAVVKSEYFEAHKAELRAKYPNLTDEEIIEKKLSVKKEKFKGIYGRAYSGKGEANGEYNIRSIGLNEQFFSHKTLTTTLQVDLPKDVETRFHAKGGDTARSVIVHELGHTIDYALDLSQDKEILRLFNQYHIDGSPIEKLPDGIMAHASPMAKELSHYANKNVAEFIAEGWSEYITSPNPRSLAKAIGDRIMEIYQRRQKV